MFNFSKTYWFILLSSFFTTSFAQTEVTFYTTKGDFIARLYDVDMPITTTNFKNLVNDKFYDNVIFHRVISGFVAQTGGYYANNLGDTPNIPDIQDEFSPNASNVQKTLGMANAGPNTGDSQFYINLANNTYLDPNYPVFGKVINNWSAVYQIGVVSTDANDRPLQEVIIDSARITTAVVAVPEHNGLQLLVSPNPIQEQSVLAIQSNYNTTGALTLYNAVGQLVYTKTWKLDQGLNTLSLTDLSLQNFSKGIYHIHFTSKDVGHISQKLIVE